MNASNLTKTPDLTGKTFFFFVRNTKEVFQKSMSDQFLPAASWQRDKLGESQAAQSARWEVRRKMISANYREIQKLLCSPLMLRKQTRCLSVKGEICVCGCRQFVTATAMWTLHFLSKYPLRADKTSTHTNTHLAFHFHRVAIRISQRLRLVEASIHFCGCKFF